MSKTQLASEIKSCSCLVDETVADPIGRYIRSGYRHTDGPNPHTTRTFGEMPSADKLSSTLYDTSPTVRENKHRTNVLEVC